jgi:predicted DNA-binding transcriptional regulator AlpA
MNKHEQDVLDRAIADLTDKIVSLESQIDNLKEARSIIMKHRGTPGHRETMNGVEVCEYLRVKRTSLARYMAGQLPPDKPPFPKPVESVGKTKYWAKEDIIAWKSAFIDRH